MSQHRKKSRMKNPPNKQNNQNMIVPVENGTTRAMRYACAGCKHQLPESDVNFVIESSRVNAAITTKYGSLYVYASGGTYPSDNRTWPYCDECYENLKNGLLTHTPTIATTHANHESYNDAGCSHCETREPAREMDVFVLNPTKIIHQKGGAGMTAASYPRIRGKAIRLLCTDCSDEFSPIKVDNVASESIDTDSIKQKYSNDEIDEMGLESELEDNLSEEEVERDVA